ncbi:MAG: transposase [Sphingobacteriales bacterium]|nr:transposase [Sphingobacteriales bacterium]MBK8678479.1 transposase [Sphingobacteriales bacterium]
MGVEIMTAIPSVAACAPNPDYNFDRFDYNNLTDTYNCPQGETLRTNGNNYLKTKENSTYYVKHYKTTKCQHCPVKLLCTKNAKGRLIERSEYQQYVDINKKT